MTDFILPDGRSFSEQSPREALMYALSHVDKYSKIVLIMTDYDEDRDVTTILHSGGGCNLAEALGMCELLKSGILGK